MKILMLCADWGIPLGGDGGSSVHFREMAGAFAELGHDVKILAANANGNTLPRGIPFDHVPTRIFWPGFIRTVERLRGTHKDKNRVRPNRTLPSPSSPTRINEISASEHKNAHHPCKLSFKTRFVYQSLPNILDHAEELAFYRFRFGDHVDRLINGWHPDLIYERYALGQTGGLQAARKAQLPFFLEVNAPLVGERTSHSNLVGIWRRLGLRDENFLWTKSSRVFCVSDELRLQVIAAGIREDKVITTPNGVNCSVFSPQQATGKLRGITPAGSILIGWLGSLSKGRGIEEFIAMLPPVLEQVPTAHAVVIGGGPLMEICRSRVAELGINSRVSFTGSVNHRLVPELLSDLDLAVASYPSDRQFYFSPMKIYEYMASALPVVAGSMGQMATLIVDGQTGILVPPDDNSAWTTALVRLCNNKQMRCDIGNNARNFVASKYSWRRNAERIYAEFQSVLQVRKR